MSSSSIQAGMAHIVLSLNDDALQRKLGTAQGRFSAFFNAVHKGAAKLAFLGDSLMAPLTGAMRSFAGFDDAMRLAGAVSGATANEFKTLTNLARELGRTTSYTAQQVADGMVALGRMGFKPAEIQESIRTMMELARATGTDLASAADIAGNALRAFGLEINQAGTVADILTATANGSAQTLIDLGEALKMAAPAARTAGESITDVNAALGVLANVGIKGSLAGNALKRAYSELAKGKTQEYLAKFGVSAKDSEGNLRKLAEVLRDCAKAMADMGSADKLQFATTVFGERAAGAALAMSADIGKIDAFLSKLQETRGVAAQTAAAMEEGIGGSMRLAASAAEGLQHSFSAAMESVTRGALNTFAAIATAIASFIDTCPTAAKVITTVAASLGAVVIAAKALLIIGNLAAPLTMLIQPALNLITVLGQLVAALAATKSAVFAFQYAMSFMTASGWVGLILAGASAVALLAYQFSKAANEAQRLRQVQAVPEAGTNADALKAKRLAELESKGTLTTAEYSEAARLNAELEKSTGKMTGVTFNGKNRSISGAGALSRRVDAAALQGERGSIAAAIAMHQRNIAAAGTVGTKTYMDPSGLANGFGGVTRYTDASGKEYATRGEAEAANKALAAAEQKALDALQRRAEVLKDVNTEEIKSAANVETAPKVYSRKDIAAAIWQDDSAAMMDKIAKAQQAATVGSAMAQAASNKVAGGFSWATLQRQLAPAGSDPAERSANTLTSINSTLTSINQRLNQEGTVYAY